MEEAIKRTIEIVQSLDDYRLVDDAFASVYLAVLISNIVFQ